MIIGGIIHQVGLHDYNMQFTVTDESTSPAAENLSFQRKVKQHCLDGLIIIDQCISDEKILWLEKENVPFLLIDRFIPGYSVNCVRVDNKKGIALLTEHLINLRHKRIAFFSETLVWNKTSEMIAGYRDTLAKYGLNYDERLLIPIDFDLDNERKKISKIMDDLLNLSNPPTAIISASDRKAVSILREVKDKGFKVPGDIVIVGYNEDPNFTHVEPPLTTVQVPLQEMGEESAKMLFQLIDNQEVENAEIVLEPKLVIRKSCGAYLVQDNN